ncbi:retrotransposon ORF1 [Tanacetum coccineum]|uniref:Retrotransposon ORF1 n=1 Tax=Tanacetum coccineum TaxID=301880 RepID=A0ABQ5EPG2_9ASTR
MVSPNKAKEKRSSSRQKQSYPRRSSQSGGSINHEGSTLPQLDFEPGYDIPLSASWTLTRGTTRYIWQRRMRKKQLSKQAKKCTAIQRCPSALKMLEPLINGLWTNLLKDRSAESYRPRTYIRGQILVDFIIEKPDKDPSTAEMPAKEEVPEPWTLFKDVSSCVEGPPSRAKKSSAEAHPNNLSMVVLQIENQHLRPLFEIPMKGEIVSGNGKQFVNNPFKDWCEKLNIKQRFASVKHPQTNGMVERANRSLGEGNSLENDGDAMFIELIKKYDDSSEEELEEDGNVVTREELSVGNDPESLRGISNFTRRGRGMHIFVGNFIYVSDLLIVEDISSVIDFSLSQVVHGRPFVEVFNMTYDSSLGIVKFTNGTDEIAYMMPHKIEQFKSLSNMEKEHKQSVYFRSEKDKRRGVDYVMNKK